eukprot:1741038-Alexandrium_andersonii.AAC.1
MLQGCCVPRAALAPAVGLGDSRMASCAGPRRRELSTLAWGRQLAAAMDEVAALTGMELDMDSEFD